MRTALILLLTLFASPALAATTDLVGQTTFYVAPNGSDSGNNCLDSGNPCRNLQYAYDFVQQNYDTRGHTVIFSMAAGVHTTGLQATGPLRGQKTASNVIIRGNILTPASVVIRPTGQFPSFTAAFGAQISIEGVKMDHINTLQDTIQVGQYATIGIAYVEFGYNVNPFNHVTVAFLANFYVYGHYFVSGGGQTHLDVANQSTVYYNTNGTAGLINVTITGSPAFHAGFLYVASNASINAQAIGWSGVATGPQYIIEGNGVIDIGCTPISGIPGNVGGTLRTGGQLLNGFQCVAPAPPDLHLSASPNVVASGGTTTLSWRANSITHNPTCWVHQLTGSSNVYFTNAPDLQTTITSGNAARGQKTSGPITSTSSYILRCLDIQGAQTVSGVVTVTVQ